MREILFRGQTRKTGEQVRMDGTPLPGHWVYGGIFPGTGFHSIIYGSAEEDFDGPAIEKHTVYSDTVGQYTGMKDKNGKRIFEGDIVKATLTRDCGGGEQVREETGVIGYDSIGMIGLIDHLLGVAPVWSDFFHELSLSGLVIDFSFEVIGNIHDNPELLEGGKDG